MPEGITGRYTAGYSPLNKLRGDLTGTKLMFTAYKEMLSPKGVFDAVGVNRALARITEGALIHEDVNRGAEIVSKMPNLEQIDLALPWMEWFDFSNVVLESTEDSTDFIIFNSLDSLTDGCLRPCSFCCDMNGLSRVKVDPFPVALYKAIYHDKMGFVFSGWRRGDPMRNLLDPFFKISLYGILKIMLGINPKFKFGRYQTSGYDLDEKHAQETFKGIGSLTFCEEEYKRFQALVSLSFHLALSNHDVIGEIFNNCTISDDFIRWYALRNSAVIDELGRNLTGISLKFLREDLTDVAGLDKFYEESCSHLKADNAVLKEYNRATIKAFCMTLKLLEVKRDEIERVHGFLLENIGKSKETLVNFRDKSVHLSTSWIFGAAKKDRGSDFYNRLALADKSDGSCLKIDRGTIHRGADRPYPVVEQRDSGRVMVRSIHGNRRELLIDSTLDELWPLSEH